MTDLPPSRPLRERLKPGVPKRALLLAAALDVVRPSLFSFFDFKDCARMAGMITGGILLRTFIPVEPVFCANTLVCRGLLPGLSAARFCSSFAAYPRFSGQEGSGTA